MLYFTTNDNDNIGIHSSIFSWKISNILFRRLEIFLSPVNWTRPLNSWWRNLDVAFPIFHRQRASTGPNATPCKVKNGITSTWRGGEWNKIFSESVAKLTQVTRNTRTIYILYHIKIWVVWRHYIMFRQENLTLQYFPRNKYFYHNTYMSATFLIKFLINWI